MEYIFNTLTDIMRQHGFSYADKDELTIHGWLVDKVSMVPNFSYDDYTLNIDIQFIDFKDYMEKFGSFFKAALNEKFALLRVDFDGEEDVCKIQLFIKRSR